MVRERLASLIARQLAGELLPEEAQELTAWADEDSGNRAFLERMSNQAVMEDELDIWTRLDPGLGYDRWSNRFRRQRKSRIIRVFAWSAAASVLAAVAIIGLTKVNSTAPGAPVVAKMFNLTVMPGRSTATLTLADGHQLLLDSVGKGQLSVQGGSKVVKSDSSSLSYLSSGSVSTGPVSYNVLTTPRSGQYQLTLPDGSKVWLNNVSSLRYPTSFQGHDRTVEVTGEAYFEIAQNATQPFFVKAEKETIEVLGTNFNVMAYPDEGGIQTTLLTGAVKVKTAAAEVRLKPDEQAQTAGDEIQVVKNVASQDIVSWKDGFFYFGRASFATVMRQLARWYDVDVVYEGKVPDMEFGGKIDRSLPLNDLLKFLDKNQIHFLLEGRKLIVLPN